jgi:hypothetical protein
MGNSALRCGQRYRLTKSASALYQSDGKPLCLHLASGSLVKLTRGPYEQGRLIEVWHQGRTLVMFVEDILAGNSPRRQQIRKARTDGRSSALGERLIIT